MDIGLVLQTDPPASTLVDRMVRAEGLGFSHGWTFDSHLLWQEPFVLYGSVLERTSRLIVGPMVTNPATRDPSVLASMFATLDATYGPRTICGMGRGDSALRTQGRPPTTLHRMESATHLIRGLTAGRTLDVDGTALSLPWVEPGSAPVPVWMAGYGPKALALAGRCADGFVLQLADPFLVRWTCEAVRSAARDAGRDPGEITMCVAAPAYVTDGSDADLRHARDQVRWFGGMVGNHVADLVERYGPGSGAPAELTDYIAGRQGYDYRHHGRAGNASTDFVPDAVVDRFCLLGPVSAQRERLDELAGLGIDQFAVYAMHDAIDPTMEAYGAALTG
ncbi:TIGR03842 family LLM class F420-dependent oxidoreductase [Pseudonocardia sp. KRD291]|uniref:TIGR03842 family LLM class F420-dependent oxidoreductase n=1 Tax=Pseudonocardia sp. KRD291 TaxID=2792007 RepID=UPI001C49E5D6|nr:TIGR03842 family LLM class F420-dependent oxidoreductase [Pseudonocardia sp. KRD291]MBW0101286.1 TIGR03842 family LLM class F420-dependent oxidoreductase [Pseudonocardia sp. KRD291]